MNTNVPTFHYFKTCRRLGLSKFVTGYKITERWAVVNSIVHINVLQSVLHSVFYPLVAQQPNRPDIMTVHMSLYKTARSQYFHLFLGPPVNNLSKHQKSPISHPSCSLFSTSIPPFLYPRICLCFDPSSSSRRSSLPCPFPASLTDRF